MGRGNLWILTLRGSSWCAAEGFGEPIGVVKVWVFPVTVPSDPVKVGTETHVQRSVRGKRANHCAAKGYQRVKSSSRTRKMKGLILVGGLGTQV